MDASALPSSLNTALDHLRLICGSEYRVTLRTTYEPGVAEPTAVEAVFEKLNPTTEPRRDATADVRPRLLTLDEVSDILNVSRRTVNTVIAEGALAVVRVRNQPRVTPEALDAYLRGAAA